MSGSKPEEYDITEHYIGQPNDFIRKDLERWGWLRVGGGDYSDIYERVGKYIRLHYMLGEKTDDLVITSAYSNTPNPNLRCETHEESEKRQQDELRKNRDPKRRPDEY